MKREQWKLIKKLSLIYISVVFILIVADVLVFIIADYGSKTADFIGCYAYDSMLAGFECTGFMGAKLVGLALSFPLYHLYMPFFVLFKPILILAVVGMWFFPLMFVLSNRKLERRIT